MALSRDLLRDPDPQVRLQAIRSAAEGGDPQAVELIGQALLSDQSPVVRSEAARSLGLLDQRRGIAFLIKAARDADPGVRQSVAGALQRLAQSPGGSPAPSLEESMRGWAARSLGDLPARPDEPPHEPTPQEKQVFHGWASVALTELGEPVEYETAAAALEQAEEGLDEEGGERQAQRAVERLVRQLDHVDDVVRQSALVTLASWRDPRVRAALLQAAEGGSTTLQEAARDALQRWENASKGPPSPDIRIRVQGFRDLGVGREGVLQVAVENRGTGDAQEFTLSCNHSVSGAAFTVAKLPPKEKGVVELRVRPTEAGSGVLFRVQANYRAPSGGAKELSTNALLPVEASVPPATPPIPRRCPACQESLDLPRAPRFCPYCGAPLPT